VTLRAPSMFLSHGAPTLPFENVAARDFLRGLFAARPKPEAVLIASAHWETEAPAVSTADKPATIHDFWGFPDALSKIAYAAPGAPAMAARAADLLRASGFAASEDPSQGLDHGAWVPMLLALEDADVPVFQLSIQPHRDPAHHFAVGRALASMRDEGVAVIGSGSATHNLRKLAWNDHRSVAPWARDFDAWFASRVEAGDEAALLDYRARAPQALQAHPTDEHLLPFYVAMGAGAKGTRIHASFTHGALSMAAYAFA
jgi:4,5-DOPA dioxygenase extradiol